MKSLCEILYAYAGEHCIQSILSRFDPERWTLEHEISQTMDDLVALGGEARRLSFRLEEMRNQLSSLEEEAAFLAGLSMGLELGTLGHPL